jgi:hypothetical protein
MRAISFFYIGIILFFSGCSTYYNGAYPKNNQQINEKIIEAEVDATEMFASAELDTKNIFKDIDENGNILSNGGVGANQNDRFKNVVQQYIRSKE